MNTFSSKKLVCPFLPDNQPCALCLPILLKNYFFRVPEIPENQKMETYTEGTPKLLLFVGKYSPRYNLSLSLNYNSWSTKAWNLSTTQIHGFASQARSTFKAKRKVFLPVASSWNAHFYNFFWYLFKVLLKYHMIVYASLISQFS